MKSAYFVHTDKDIGRIEELTSKGYDLITSNEGLELFSRSKTVVIGWERVLNRDYEVVGIFREYDEIVASSCIDLIEAMFLHQNAKHYLELRGFSGTQILNLFGKEIQNSLLQQWDAALYKYFCKASYLLGKYDECELMARKSLLVYGLGEDALNLLIACAAAKGQVQRALELLNCLAYDPRYKTLLDVVLLERDEKQKIKWLFRAAKDFVSGEKG